MGSCVRAASRVCLSSAARVVALVSCLLLFSCASYSHLATDLLPAEGRFGRDHRGAQELVFLVFGDSGVGGEGQANVGRTMQTVCAQHSCDFALLLGDNIYNRGVRSVDDPQFQRKFEEPYAPLGPLDIWAVPGNHDWRRPASVQAQIAYTARSDRWRMPYNHFAVPRLPDWIRLYGLDTTVVYDLSRQGDPVKREALAQAWQAQLAAASATLCGGEGWKVLFGHHPIYSGGQHGRSRGPRGVLPEIEEALLPDLIQACGIHVYVAGHDHHQEHIRAPDFEQIIQGAAGRELRGVERRDAPGRWQAFGASRHGFGLLTVTPARLSIEFFEAGPSATVTRLYATTCARTSEAVECT